MKIKNKQVKYSDYFNIGQWVYELDINNFGIEIDIKELLNEAQLYNYIVIKGEPFQQKQEVSKFIKNIITKNNNVKIYIYCKGTEKPTTLSNLSNIIYNVVIQTTNNGLNYNNRINDNINYFINMGANFIFTLNDKKDLNEVEVIIINNSIPRYLVYIDYPEDVSWLYKVCKNKKYNICINLKDVFNEFC